MLWLKRLFRRQPGASTRALRRAVDALPAPDREIYLLIAAEQLSYSEVASRLRVTADQVESGFARALSTLDRARPWLGSAGDDPAEPLGKTDDREMSGISTANTAIRGDAT